MSESDSESVRSALTVNDGVVDVVLLQDSRGVVPRHVCEREEGAG